MYTGSSSPSEYTSASECMSCDVTEVEDEEDAAAAAVEEEEEEEAKIGARGREEQRKEGKKRVWKAKQTESQSEEAAYMEWSRRGLRSPRLEWIPAPSRSFLRNPEADRDCEERAETALCIDVFVRLHWT